MLFHFSYSFNVKKITRLYKWATSFSDRWEKRSKITLHSDWHRCPGTWYALCICSFSVIRLITCAIFRPLAIHNTTHHQQRASVCIQIFLDSVLFASLFFLWSNSAIEIISQIANTVNSNNLNVSTDLLRIDSTTYTHNADVFKWFDSTQKCMYLNSSRSLQKTVFNSVFVCLPHFDLH